MAPGATGLERRSASAARLTGGPSSLSPTAIALRADSKARRSSRRRHRPGAAAVGPVHDPDRPGCGSVPDRLAGPTRGDGALAGGQKISPLERLFGGAASHPHPSLEAPPDREVSSRSRHRSAQHQAFPGGKGEAQWHLEQPRRVARSQNRRFHRCAGQPEPDVPQRLERSPAHGQFQRCAIGRVSDQTVGQVGRAAIERTARRHAPLAIAEPSRVLHGRPETRIDDDQAHEVPSW